MHIIFKSQRVVLLTLVVLLCQVFVRAQAPERNITIPTPTSVADLPKSSAAGNSSSSLPLSRNAISTASGNSTNTNTTLSRTSSAPDPTKPFATDYATETYRVPAPACPGGGNVAQSPDDSVSLVSIA